MNLPVQTIPRTIKDVIEQNASMKSYLQGLLRGRDATPHSWLYENESSDVTLARWLRILVPELKKTPFGDTFYHFDAKQLEKFGPQGKVPPITDPEALEVLQPLYEPSEYDDEMALSQYFPYTFKFARFLFGSDTLRMAPKLMRTVTDNMRERDTLSSNSGFPRFRERESVLDAEIWDALHWDAYTYPAILLFRQYNGKLRPVWMYPMSMNLREGSFSQLIQETLRNQMDTWIREWLSPWVGFEQVKKTLTKEWPKPSPVVGGDTTKMDAHMRKAQIRLVYEIVKWLFRKEFWDTLKQVMIQVNTIPLLIGPDKWLVGPHGLASGSGWTQLSETILIMFRGYLLDIKFGMGIGDDFMWRGYISAEETVQYLGDFGLPANPDKQDVGTDQLSFLQRLFHQGFFSREDRHVLGAYYPTIRALNSSLNPEKFHKPKLWNSDMFCARQYMILENCVDDPVFVEFVKFVVRGQKDLIPFAKKSKDELARIQSEARLVPGLNPSYNQEKRDKPLWRYESIRMASLL